MYNNVYDSIFFLSAEKTGNKSLPLNEHEIKAARIFGLLPVSTINRNKVKIHSLSRPASPTLNDENDIASSSIQKTCIKINTDSSSTVNVNVNDSVKLYHSSVLINSSTHQFDDMNNQNKTVKYFNCENKILDPSNNKDRSDCHLSKDTKTAIAILYTNTNEQNPAKDQPLELSSTSESDSKTLVSLNNSDSEYLFSGNSSNNSSALRLFIDSFILKLMSDPCLSHLLHGLEVKAIANIIENSLARIPINKFNVDNKGAKSSEADELLLKQLHDIIKEERYRIDSSLSQQTSKPKAFPMKSTYCNLTISTGGSENVLLNSENIPLRNISEKFAECSVNKSGETFNNLQNDHQYESICLNYDPIYEEINEEPPPLPVNPPPLKNEFSDKNHKSMFLGATKYDILSYLVDAKDRMDPEEQVLSYTYKFLQRSVDETVMENVVEKNGKIINSQEKCKSQDKCTGIERNDSGVGSETSKSSRTKYLPGTIENDIPPIHLCEDCGKKTE